ncbi:hypothetical protein GCK72_021730 [Caenorhabditis remanei]|uniref:G-protein coupled receptors family 1 profile domain-containing protein n=1 Tax=Caenorhabditis remanei TaxID=31234 RepID=A0A6A5GKP5_CAERE|nr:hypothetical protein GCK72_021730 [Caenorhabditis remanei]KAF1755161.1 hypothetical protein GCK72_021730 [Caenorhabditis remanei]
MVDIVSLSYDIHTEIVDVYKVFKFIPCILFPIVTYLLVKEIRAADERRKKLNQSSIAGKDSKNTTKLVLFLTLPFFLGELPIGLILLTKPIDKLREAIGFSLFTEGIEKLFSVVLSATTATHMIVCLFMSSQYREAALSFIRCGVKVKSQNS